MLKGPRFIWYFWTKRISAKLKEYQEFVIFEGEIAAYRHLDKGLKHKRIFKIYKEQLKWEITDEIFSSKKFIKKQLWHYPVNEGDGIKFASKNREEKQLIISKFKGLYSSKYGVKEESLEAVVNFDDYIKTTIEYKK